MAGASAVGKAVVRFEQRLGVRLFHRNTRSMTLTEEGRLFLDRCRRIFEEIEAGSHSCHPEACHGVAGIALDMGKGSA